MTVIPKVERLRHEDQFKAILLCSNAVCFETNLGCIFVGECIHLFGFSV